MLELAAALQAAANVRVWEIPIDHRTKDSVSAYRAAVGAISGVLMQVLNKHRNPEPQTPLAPAPEIKLNEPVLSEPEMVPEPEPEVAAPNSLFDEAPAEPRRRRRNQGENDAA